MCIRSYVIRSLYFTSMAEPLVEAFLAKGRQSLDGAVSEFEAARYDNCANRAYYACFLAAVAALIDAGIVSPARESRWSHEVEKQTDKRRRPPDEKGD